MKMKLAFLIVVFCSANAFGQNQINIIQIVADDLGWVDLSTGATNLNNGSPYYQTANIDALASSGMSFSSAYVQQVCAPTRAALLTGQYSPRNGLHTVGSLNSIGDSTLLVVPQDGSFIKPEAITIAELLKSAGYVTAHFGKFHCTDESDDIVDEHGFDFNIGGTNSGGPTGTVPYFADEVQPGVWRFGNSHGPELDPFAAPYTSQYIVDHLLPFANSNDPLGLDGTPKHLNDSMADAAIEFLGQRVEDRLPFFMNVAFNAVHGEVHSRTDLEAKYAGLPTSTNPDHDSAEYAGLLEGMDQAIGSVVDFVQSNGLSRNTMIVFVSDNGANNITDNFPLSGGKSSFQEGGIRVPLIINQPGTIPAGATCTEAIHIVDLFKTYAEITGTSLPSPSEHTLDGESIAGILVGTQTELIRESIYYHFPGYLNNGTVPFTAVIHDAIDGNRYKLYYYFEDRSYRMFDLTNDISETTDLIENGLTTAQFSIATCLGTQISEWIEDVGAKLPVVRSTGNSVSSPRHSPSITFELGDLGLGGLINGQETAVLSLNGVSMSIAAEGNNALFQTADRAAGVNSDDDSGSQMAQRRIDGSLMNPEGVLVSFDRNVVLKKLNVFQLSGDGNEALTMELVTGDNPFESVVGYDDSGFSIAGTTLTYVSLSGNGQSEDIPFGALDQDEILLTAGAVVRFSSNPSIDSGFTIGSIGVAIPQVVYGDVNIDGMVNLLDVMPFVLLLSNTNYQLEGDFNKDGFVNLLDVSPFIESLTGI